MVFTYVPGTGTTMTIDGKDKVTIAGPGIRASALLGMAGTKASECRS